MLIDLVFIGLSLYWMKTYYYQNKMLFWTNSGFLVIWSIWFINDVVKGNWYF